MRNDHVCGVLGGVDVKSSAGFLEDFHCFQNILFALFAKPRQIAKFSFFCQLFHVRHCSGFEVGPQESDFLRAQRLQLEQIQNGRRIFLQQFFAQGVIAGLHDFLQVFHHAVADSGELLELFRFLDELLDGFGQTIDKFGSLLIAAVPADNGPIDFQKLRGIPEDSCDLFVVHIGRL